MSNSASNGPRPTVTARAILIALAIIPANSYWLYLTEVVHYTGVPTVISVFFNVICVLLLLLGVNSLLSRFASRLTLTRPELITVFAMVGVASLVGGHNMIEVLLPAMVHPFRFATPENRWGELFLNQMPSWLTVSEPRAVKGFYEGGVSFYAPDVFWAWVTPALAWTGFILVLCGLMLFLNVLLRKQWTEREKLTYPVVQIPLDLTSGNAGFLRNRLLWLGFGLAVAYNLMQGLHAIYPSFPGLSDKGVDLGAGITSAPWSAIGSMWFRFYPFAMGLGFVAPIDLLFSTWFFYVMTKVQVVVAAMLGWSQIPGFPYPNEQMIGSYIGICAFALWIGRRSLAGVISRAFGSGDSDLDKDEPVSYRVALCGAGVCLAVLMAFCISVGMSPLVALAFLVVYCVLSVGITRMRAELGPPAYDVHYTGPDALIPALIGPASLGTGNLVGLTLMFWFNRAYYAHPMPFMLESFKMGEQTGANYRRLFFAILIAVVAGSLAAFWIQLHVCYNTGVTTGMKPPSVPMVFGSYPYTRLEGWLISPGGPRMGSLYGLSAGFLFALVLNALRLRLSWFPFSPVGYAISGSFSISLLWFSLFLTWAIKLCVMRYGGLRLYRVVAPAFHGLVLGEAVMWAIWSGFSIITGVQSYSFWP